ncbi:MTH1187 family thiamine-binding protein [Thiorhodococcus mannitoliphagus]|uniref:MTH1187 family thiamine-binding protein n=1 Tax=Thiorhodococcus mannitoliphagus TaxID=329406 RepID=A0A6P1DXV5_9GAMM|nr:MTH1187 family thiamine-binding protein [Thiorhodococcus mannitoliphagus]NEX22529.1 MTH1187 family thiamine-binding protein [Thiorhodococcus mannitoliphagus]
MSVILDLAMFPTDQGVSVSRFVAPLVAMIRDSGLDYQLSPMGTQVETDTLPEALELIARAQSLLDEQGCTRVYAVAKFDVRQGPKGRLKGKIQSVEGRIGSVSQGN